MADLLSMLGYLLTVVNKFMLNLGGVLNVLVGAVTFLLKLGELWERIKQFRSKKGKNKGSTKRNSRKNP